MSESVYALALIASNVYYLQDGVETGKLNEGIL